ncbi:class I SAM-dependent methyltransferase [Aquiflexum lacus]|uniref:class I SAM-dependent methyltransferase n=1 Tax=Aquiflexum lacus TaxID=2483805 RepID=UPI0018930D91|nr:class I SAM-dependent methyltransferase [Aquiflexum lacus]
MKIAFSLILLFGFFYLTPLIVFSQEITSDFSDLVPFVTTPDEVVEAMLKLAEIDENDILYDLGSGDGRIPIAAAKLFGANAIGVEIDAALVALAKQNALKSGVSDRVTFVQGDLFEIDFSDATILVVYLFPDINLKLRPKFLKMKPGTRIVSHRFDMGDWKPEKTERIVLPDGKEHLIYLWRVPQ